MSSLDPVSISLFEWVGSSRGGFAVFQKTTCANLTMYRVDIYKLNLYIHNIHYATLQIMGFMPGRRRVFLTWVYFFCQKCYKYGLCCRRMIVGRYNYL